MPFVRWPLKANPKKVSDFLSQSADWSIVELIGQDGSSRRYTRVAKKDRSAILMEASGEETPGHSISDFLQVGEWLNSIGLKAPDIYEVGEDFLLLEDFGDVSFKKALDQGHDPRELYGLAAEVLDFLSERGCPLKLPDYYESHVHERHRQIIDWYVPAVRKEQNPEDLLDLYSSVWSDIEDSLPSCPQGFVHVDFHAENLMLLGEEKGIRRCGILDFQGAMVGPAPYDFGNLLEDARMDLPEDVRQEILQSRSDEFLAHYRVLTTQFHCRVIGQFIKMAIEDNKTQYLQYVPRVSSYIAKAIEDPVLKPLKQFFEDIKLDLGEYNLDLKNLKSAV